MRKLAVVAIALICGSATAEPWSANELAEKARVAGIDGGLVVEPAMRLQLIEALREKIELGYKQEKAFKMAARRVGMPGELSLENWQAYRDEYLAHDAVAFRAVMDLAAQLACVELIPMLMERGDMTVDWEVDDGSRFAAAAVRGMGRPAVAPLLAVIANDPDEDERIFAIEALKGLDEDCREEMGGEPVAVRMARILDIEDPNVLKALDSLKGEMSWEQLFEAAGKPVAGAVPAPAQSQAAGVPGNSDDSGGRPVIPINWVLWVVLGSVVAAALGIGVSLLGGRGRKG